MQNERHNFTAQTLAYEARLQDTGGAAEEAHEVAADTIVNVP
jgi:hypothetical protein